MAVCNSSWQLTLSDTREGAEPHIWSLLATGRSHLPAGRCFASQTQIPDEPSPELGEVPVTGAEMGRWSPGWSGLEECLEERREGSSQTRREAAPGTKPVAWGRGEGARSRHSKGMGGVKKGLWGCLPHKTKGMGVPVNTPVLD